MHPTAKTALTLLFCFKSFAANKVSILSFLAASINPQVLTNTASASLGSVTNSIPSFDNRAANSSLSTSLRAQPKVNY